MEKHGYKYILREGKDMHKILTKAIKIIQICFIVCFLILTNLLFYNYVNSNKISEKSGEEYLEREEYNFSDIFQDENDYIEQKFHPIRPELENIRIRLAINHANLPYDFTILIEFCEGDQVLKREEITNKQIKNWTYYNFEIARKLGADGVVFGCLTAEGEVDLPAMQKLMEAAQGLSVTFHRAFDVCRNPQKALEQIIKLGCNRILTCG